MFVADRDAFVRPSFNPSLRATTRDHPTDDGRPIWDDAAGTYRPPHPGEPLYDSYLKATEHFVGYTTPGFGCPQDADACAPKSLPKTFSFSFSHLYLSSLHQELERCVSKGLRRAAR